MLSERTADAIRHTLSQVRPTVTQRALPYADILNIALLPAHILLPNDKVCNEIYLSVTIAASDGRTCRVKLLGKFVQRTNI